MLGQLDGLQMVKKERDLPLLVGVCLHFLAGLPRPIPLISRGKENDPLTINDETVRVCEGIESAGSQGAEIHPFLIR